MIAPLSEIRRLAGVEGFRPAFRYDGSDTPSLIRLAAAGHGLALLPETALPATGIAAVPVATPRVVHRVELAHGHLRAGSPAAELAALLAALAKLKKVLFRKELLNDLNSLAIRPEED